MSCCMSMSSVVTIVIILVLACCEAPRRKFPLNMILLGIFTIAESFLLGVITAYAHTYILFTCRYQVIFSTSISPQLTRVSSNLANSSSSLSFFIHSPLKLALNFTCVLPFNYFVFRNFFTNNFSFNFFTKS